MSTVHLYIRFIVLKSLFYTFVNKYNMFSKFSKAAHRVRITLGTEFVSDVFLTLFSA